MIESFAFIGDIAIATILTDKLTAAGFRVAKKVSEADAILVYCESQAEVEDVFFDSKGVIQNATRGTFLINLSACTPNFSRELSAIATVSDLCAVEAPLMVIDPTKQKAFADHTNVDCFLAGEEDDVKKVLPIVGILAANIRECGPTGSGQLAHAALTIQRSAQLVACIEAEALCRAYSSSSDEAIRAAFEQGLISDINLKIFAAIKNEKFEGDYSIKMWMAELTSALMSADDSELILPGAESCIHLLELLSVIGGETLTPPALSLVYGEESNCVKYGLDWAKAEQIYGEGEDDEDEGGYPGVFGGFSSN